MRGLPSHDGRPARRPIDRHGTVQGRSRRASCTGRSHRIRIRPARRAATVLSRCRCRTARGLRRAQGLQIQQANLCASCHTILLPVFDADGNQVIEDGEPKFEYEQTTFFEWLNSGFITIPCQQCHMPDSYQDNPLQFKIANIEDSTFPAVPDQWAVDAPAGRRSDPGSARRLIGAINCSGSTCSRSRCSISSAPTSGYFKFDPNLPGPLAQADLRPEDRGGGGSDAGSDQHGHGYDFVSDRRRAAMLQADVRWIIWRATTFRRE